MKSTQARHEFRALLESGHCFHPASVFDPLSARLAADAGFEAGILAGSTASLSVLGAPDLIVLTLTELAEQARRICRAASLPLLVDADHGYGGALSVRRTVEELESAGVAALTIEDTNLPAPFGSLGKASLISCEEGVGKMRAALSARDDASTVITGRTSALLVTGMADTLKRIAAYETAGVDAIFLVGVKTWVQLEEIRAAIRVPLMLGNPDAELSDRARLASLGVAISLQGHQTAAAVVQALQLVYQQLRDNADPAALAGLASPGLMKQVTRAALYENWTEQFGSL